MEENEGRMSSTDSGQSLLYFGQRQPEGHMEETKYPIWAKPHSRDDELATAIRRAVTANFRRTADGGEHVQRAEVNFAVVEYPRRNKPAEKSVVIFHGIWIGETGYGLIQVGRTGQTGAKLEAQLQRSLGPKGESDLRGVVRWERCPGARWTHEELEEVALAGGRALLFMLLDNKFNRPMTGDGKDCDSPIIADDLIGSS